MGDASGFCEFRNGIKVTVLPVKSITGAVIVWFIACVSAVPHQL